MARKTVKPWDRKPTTAESLDATIHGMGGNRLYPSTDSALRIVLEQLERGDCYSLAKATLLRKRIERGGRIVKPAGLLAFDYPVWIKALRQETKAPGRRAQIALLIAMELPRDTAMRLAAILRLDMYVAQLLPRGVAA
jgi:hypothetical protein